MLRRSPLTALPVVLLAAPGPGVSGAVAAQAPPVRYEVSFPNRVHHEARVRIRYTDLRPGPLELRMSRTSPGRYALHEFAKNVYDVTVTDAGGRELPVHRPDPHQWTVTGHGGEVEVAYTLFADRADGTYSAVDESHAHLNAPATFMWARGLFARPVRLTVRVPDGSGWRVATQLEPTDDPFVFTARNHDYFLDSPVEVSDFALREWTRGGQTIRAAVHHLGTTGEVDRYADHAAEIVRVETAVFGELPAFDHGTYTFIACYLPWADGDGMEHRNSTILTSSGSLAENMVGLLGTVAHEFFHAWSIERIRPSSLEPFDFEAANMSRELWFGEGFTSYYDDVALARAGIIDAEAFARRLGGSIDAVSNAPGRRHFSPVGMSMQAPFVDAAVSVDPINHPNTFVSYYTWGSVVGAALDLTLRTRFDDVTLDDLMREMWRRHGDPERPYAVEDVESALAAVTGDGDFARDFFDRYVRRSEVPAFEALLPAAGMILRRAAPDRPLLARTGLAAGDGGLLVTGSTLEGTPLYEAGADRGDRLLSADGREIRSRADLEGALGDRRPGDTLRIVYRSRGDTREATVTLQADPALEVVLVEAAGDAPSEEALSFRSAWIGLREGG